MCAFWDSKISLIHKISVKLLSEKYTNCDSYRSRNYEIYLTNNFQRVSDCYFHIKNAFTSPLTLKILSWWRGFLFQWQRFMNRDLSKGQPAKCVFRILWLSFYVRPCALAKERDKFGTWEIRPGTGEHIILWSIFYFYFSQSLKYKSPV